MSRSADSRSGVSVLRRLSGDPGRSMNERVLHHGARVVLLLALVALVTTLFMPTAGPGMPQYEEGMVAPEDVIAKIPFPVPKTPEELQRDRSLAMSSVPPTFTFVPEAADTMEARLRVFFDQLDSAAAQGQRAGIERMLHQTSVMASPSQVDALVDPATRRLLRETALDAAARFIPHGVADAGQTGDITSATVTVRQGDVERSVPANEIRTQRDFFEEALQLLPPGTAPDVRNVLRLILIRHIEFSYLLDVLVTERDRDAAARSVHTTKDEVLQGQAIVRAADRIGPTELERLSAYETELRREGLLRGGQVELVPVLGAALLNLMLLAIFGLLLFFFRPEVYGNFRWVLLIGLLVAAYFAAAAGIARNGLSHELLPIAFVGLPMAVLWDTRMALVLVLVLAGLTGTLPPFTDYGTVLVVMSGGAAAAMSVRAVRRRSQTWVSIAIIAAATALVLLGHGLATSRDLGSIARASMFSAGNATVSALLAMGFLWVFELFTGITTDQTLLEWADPTRPLLKRLSLEAPGTYAHSINVANLAEAAANGIGANGLLCRVGVYYHDVGKMLKPHYFVENQPEGRNPHDKLKPETSATIVREHVTEGVRLARDSKVPEVVVDFILQHHGTQRIGFFYEKAREEAGEDLDEGRFSYPGPRPQTKETALVMLADSCESAARAMRDPTPERVRDLIRTVIRAKIDDGQLDEAPLTLREVAQIEEQFVKILSGVMHRRIDYPATKHLTDAPS
ncbi:MAG: HDIG domain-containing protein, partial [Gemmatimonadetes bacterium]|nr:HDIG domain-containing protein [Gemmatimonadota bacterium]